MEAFVQEILRSWSGQPLQTAKEMIQKYGYPHEATMNSLTWYNNGPWKRTILHRETVPHNFPHPHQDFLEQTIDYKVPIHLYDDLAAFDGSAYLDRTKGEVSAMCDKEAMNILSLNVLNDIVTGKRDVEGAKMFLAQTAYMYLKQNTPSAYTERLLFPKQYQTNDPGMIYFE
ncbi:hypothetical protein [Oceanobacillus bengalensis]|uniref:Uncharacterized protein n=1 Tax=Oceanobacillus bengalensis TaxID=1435466 RepID=A0A494Z7P4_9BACI|nr:hypothetical protein [Oceanobacillus bengalensis]RKQ18605.1 hypothetical protein D8M05_00375 [Oceanobacillus bengalensis]